MVRVVWVGAAAAAWEGRSGRSTGKEGKGVDGRCGPVVWAAAAAGALSKRRRGSSDSRGRARAVAVAARSVAVASLRA